MNKISVIVPVYNVEQYLAKCLDSVINQTYKNLEIICVDDGSSDNSGRILDEYAAKDERIKVIHGENRGVSVARNKGLDVATGDWISFLDADDWLDVNAYEKLLKSIKGADVDIIIFGNYCVYDGITAKYKPINIEENKLNDYSYLLLKLGSLVWNKLYKRSVIENNKLRFVEHIKLSEDGLFNIELMLQYPKIQTIDEGLYYYVIYRQGSTLSGQHGLDKELLIRDYLLKQEFYNKSTNEERLAIDIKILCNLIYRYERLTLENKLKNIDFLQEYEVYLQKKYSKKELSKFKQIKQLRKLIKLKGKEDSLFARIFSIKNSKDKTQKILVFLGIEFRIKNKRRK